MEVTNRRTFDPAMQAELRAKMSTAQSVQNDMARQHLDRLLQDIQKGEDQKRDWKPR